MLYEFMNMFNSNVYIGVIIIMLSKNMLVSERFVRNQVFCYTFLKRTLMTMIIAFSTFDSFDFLYSLRVFLWKSHELRTFHF